MAPPAVQKWREAEQIEARLKALIKDREGKATVTFEEIDSLMFVLRQACEATILFDIEFASTSNTGARLWDAHVLVNTRYRKLLERLSKKEGGGSHKVEQRKSEKHYVDFLKTSSYFYTGFIQRLASHFGGIPELEKIANSLALSPLSNEQPVELTDPIRKLVVLATHATLLRLGDLARYRNKVKRNAKNQTWEKALAFYQLSNDFYPVSGSGHNQMAVIALEEDDHLNAVYHLYRALTAEDPHPLANQNLMVEFKKVNSGFEKKRLPPQQESLATLVWWFCLLQSKFYDGVEFSTHEELENEVLSRMALLLKEQSFEDIIDKFVIISIAAQHYAAKRVQKEDATNTATSSYFFCLEFNVRMLFIFLQVLLPELEDHSFGEDLPNGKSKERETFTAVARRVFPAIRQYGVWLATSAPVLSAAVGPESLQIHKRELLTQYAYLMGKLTQVYPMKAMNRVDYMLDEDALTVGFPPLQEKGLADECNLHVTPEGLQKPRIYDNGKQLPNIEMESRVLDILRCAVRLNLDQMIPLTITPHSDGVYDFTYHPDGLPQTNSVLAAQREPTPPLATPTQFGTNGLNGLQHPTGVQRSSKIAPSAFPDSAKLANQECFEAQAEGSATYSENHGSMDDHMEQMVNDLVTHSARDETSYGMHSRTANEVFAQMGSQGMECTHSTPKMLPSLPGSGLYNSAFTPKPNELQPSSPNRPTTARQLSPLCLSTSENRRASALAFDDSIGFPPGTWSRNSPRRVSDEDLPVAQALQMSFAQQHESSNAFSNPSSLYFNNTPGYGHAHGPVNGNGMNGNSTFYLGASAFDRETMLQSSLWNGSQPAYNGGGFVQTPPGGQGG